jgi:hypothetical protein
VEGSTLRACLADGKSPRPNELKESERALLYTFRRVSAGGTSPTHASVIGQDYDDNAALGDEKYTGKELVVMGPLVRVRRREGGGYVLHVQSGSTPLLFEFGPGARAELARLTKGELVIIQGKCKGPEGESRAVMFSQAKLLQAKD